MIQTSMSVLRFDRVNTMHDVKIQRVITFVGVKQDLMVKTAR